MRVDHMRAKTRNAGEGIERTKLESFADLHKSKYLGAEPLCEKG